MTLVIGLKCSNGIVMGADSAATMDDGLGQPTIRQPYKKLEIIANRIIIGNSGPVGLAQQIRPQINDLWSANKLSGKRSHQAMGIIREKIIEVVKPELEMAGIARPALGNVAYQSAICATLVALPLSKRPCLLHFNHQCSPEEITESIPFTSIGSGRTLADPFLAFLKRIFWEKTQPNVIQGIFTVFWALDHAIRIAPGGIANPKQIIILEQSQSQWEARELSEDELKEHIEGVEAAEQHLRNYPAGFSETGQVSEPPKPNGT